MRTILCGGGVRGRAKVCGRSLTVICARASVVVVVTAVKWPIGAQTFLSVERRHDQSASLAFSAVRKVSNFARPCDHVIHLLFVSLAHFHASNLQIRLHVSSRIEWQKLSSSARNYKTCARECRSKTRARARLLADSGAQTRQTARSRSHSFCCRPPARSHGNGQIADDPFSRLWRSAQSLFRDDKVGQPQSVCLFKVLQLDTLDVPTTLEPTQVLVRLLAAPINPLDVNMTQGAYVLRRELPAIAGAEGVGEVLKV